MVTADDVAARHPDIAERYPFPWRVDEFKLIGHDRSAVFTFEGIVCGPFGIARIQTGEFIVVWTARGVIVVVCRNKPRAIDAVEGMLSMGNWSETVPVPMKELRAFLLEHGAVPGVNRGLVDVAVVMEPQT